MAGLPSPTPATIIKLKLQRRSLKSASIQTIFAVPVKLPSTTPSPSAMSSLWSNYCNEVHLPGVQTKIPIMRWFPPAKIGNSCNVCSTILRKCILACRFNLPSCNGRIFGLEIDRGLSKITALPMIIDEFNLYLFIFSNIIFPWPIIINFN